MNIYSDHNNLLYAADNSEYKRLISWGLILKEFGYNIHQISWVENIAANILSRFPSTTDDQNYPRTTRALSWVNKLFETILEQTSNNGYPLYLVLVKW